MASEPIKVFIRFRPLSVQECDQGEDILWNLNKNSVSILNEDLNLFIGDKKLSSSYNPCFQFDHCFSWSSDNQEVYAKVAKNLVLSALDGYNATIFAYGQTGSGKTYTMLGKHEESSILAPISMNIDLERPPKASETPKKAISRSNGIIIQALQEIFESAKNFPDRKFFFSCSYMEIYNEHVYDLLKSSEEFTTESLSVVEGLDKEFIVKNLSEQVVTSIDEVLERLHKGEENRHYAKTNLNHHSSRSHTIFKLNVCSITIMPRQGCDDDKNFENITTESALNFVDLAGSEKVNTLQAAAEMEKIKHTQFSLTSHKSDIDKIMAEGKNINTSLFYLCQVINKLSEKKLGIIKNDSHIPFRNSNLTKILRSSLAGNARTCIICTATAARSQFEQTLSTLRFGNSARSITNKVRANIRTETNAQLLLTYEQDIAILKKEVELTYQRGKAYLNETLVTKQHLENKILNLSRKIMSKQLYMIVSTPKNCFESLWSARVGELFTSQPEQTAEKYLTWGNDKFTDKGISILKEMQIADREKKNLQLNIINIGNSINCIQLAYQSLFKEKENYDLMIENAYSEKENLTVTMSQVLDKAKKLDQKIKIFETGEGIQEMQDDQAEKLENLLVERIKNIKQEKARREYQSFLCLVQQKIEELDQSPRSLL
jgi:Kinesin motor domain